MQVTLARMPEKCDPYIYYQRVRLPMSGWRNNPDLPDGLLYEGEAAECHIGGPYYLQKHQRL
jgi:indoleamine 2,3-dioxygenase